MLFLFWKRLYPAENSLTMRVLMVQEWARRTWGPPTNWRLTGLMGSPGNGGKLLPLRVKRSRSFQGKEPESFLLVGRTLSIFPVWAFRDKGGQRTPETGGVPAVLFLCAPGKRGQ